MLDILYVSTVCSERINDYLFSTATKKPVQSAQKFHRLIVEGLAQQKQSKIELLSSIPVISSRHKRRIWFVPKEKKNNIVFNYIGIINYPILKPIFVFFGCFFKTLVWAISKKKSNKIIICDALNVTTTCAASLAARLTFTKCIGIVTDLPGLMVSENENDNSSNEPSTFEKFNYRLLGLFDGYILLTEQMNDLINKRNVPFIIMEGLVDFKMKAQNNIFEEKEKEKIVIYAGGLYQKYGIKKLVEAFVKTKDNNARLHLFGVGPMVDEIVDYSKKDNRIQYKGMVPNEEIIKNQLKATLLVNPRFSTEEFTKYSFPSKNLEYMVSGTPSVTTPLPGMPKDYYEYVYIFEDESVDGMSKKIDDVLSIPRKDLHDFGLRAKKFVLENKNNLKQSLSIYELAQEILRA